MDPSLSSALPVMDLNILYAHLTVHNWKFVRLIFDFWDLLAESSQTHDPWSCIYAVHQQIIITCKFILVLPEPHSLRECILNLWEAENSLFLHIHMYLAFAEVNMSSKVSKETLFESVHAVLQVIKSFYSCSFDQCDWWLITNISGCKYSFGKFQHFVVPGREGQTKEVPGDCWPPDWPEELRPPKGQAFLWHRQVWVHLRLY